MNRYLLFLLLPFLLSASLVADDSGLAWWLRDQYEPSAVTSALFKMSDINPEWVKFKLLSYSDLSDEAKKDIPWMEEYGYKFSIDGDFNKDGRSDKAVVGVYENKNGEKGRFLLILTKRKNGRWAKEFLDEIKGEPGFSVLYKCGNSICWSECMECDGGHILEWKKGGYYLDATGVD